MDLAAAGLDESPEFTVALVHPSEFECVEQNGELCTRNPCVGHADAAQRIHETTEIAVGQLRWMAHAREYRKGGAVIASLLKNSSSETLEPSMHGRHTPSKGPAPAFSLRRFLTKALWGRGLQTVGAQPSREELWLAKYKRVIASIVPPAFVGPDGLLQGPAESVAALRRPEYVVIIPPRLG